MRESGILLPIFSLPSDYGIGCFSKEAYEFVDQLLKAGQKKWQILPLGPTGYGDSPYQSFSTFAGNPYFIDLHQLIERGLLTVEELEDIDFGKDETAVDYGKLYEVRYKVLAKAFERFIPDQEYEEYIQENAFWLEDYSLFMAEKDEHNGNPWTMWEDPLRHRDEQMLSRERERLQKQIKFYQFQQYLFRKQWDHLHKYANDKGIEIIGDIPIYVALDSADTWANPELFQFDENKVPIAVAGCPVDGFSATGQLWGNPLYDWPYHKETGYAWWKRRVSFMMEMYDVLRVDHFRGFDAYYAIPFEDETAEFGHWEEGPGMDLIRALKEVIGEKRIIAEDLGYMTESVKQMVRESGYPGMKVLQFAFDSREESDYLPHNYDKNCVVYTGTHDNDTIQGWYDSMDDMDREFSQRYMNNKRTPRNELHMDFIRMAMASVADLCIIPIQDYLGLGREARINIPSTLGRNWKWRLKKGEITDIVVDRIREVTKVYGR